MVATMLRHLGKSSRVDKLRKKMDADLQQPGLSDARSQHARAYKCAAGFLKIGEDACGPGVADRAIGSTALGA